MAPPFYPVPADFRGHGPAIAVAFFLPFIGGLILDVHLHTGPFFFTIGTIVGFLAAVGVVLFFREDFRD